METLYGAKSFSGTSGTDESLGNRSEETSHVLITGARRFVFCFFLTHGSHIQREKDNTSQRLEYPSAVDAAGGRNTAKTQQRLRQHILHHEVCWTACTLFAKYYISHASKKRNPGHFEQNTQRLASIQANFGPNAHKCFFLKSSTRSASSFLMGNDRGSI